MNSIYKLALLMMMGISVQAFADDINFISPQNGANINGKTIIQIQPPFQNTDVRVWIKKEDGIEKIVWRGTLSSAKNYSITVDASKFAAGRYEIKAEYYINGQEFDGDIDVWVGNSAGNSEEGEYLP
ncbi:MAG: hypothetical protein ACRCS8_02585 [Brevinema sp.]